MIDVVKASNATPNNKTAILGPLLSADEALAEYTNIHQSLQFFDAVSLNDVQNSLLTRSDTKFLLSLSTLQSLLPTLAKSYDVLDIDGERIFDYHNLYLDSEDMRLFQNHHRGVYPRHKVRYRYYQQTDDVFLELKAKGASKQTVKLRERLNAKGGERLEACQRITGLELTPKLRGRYKRISLASKQNEERLTLDFDLHFGLPQGKKSIQLRNVVIAELKQPRRSYHSPFATQIRKSSALQTSFSKYCVGCCYLYLELKHNHFKPLLQRLAKLA